MPCHVTLHPRHCCANHAYVIYIPKWRTPGLLSRGCVRCDMRLRLKLDLQRARAYSGGVQQVYAIDLLGFGASSKPILEYTIELWRDLVLDFMAEFIDTPTVLIGNSLGSLIALAVRP